jgi:hypothetical protein
MRTGRMSLRKEKIRNRKQLKLIVGAVREGAR